ncbi:PQQ-binding-like beta-propeller repeat protein [bacterium]|nr:PQQ-binding-like beta-propeller repeat protein [bacterium]
MMLKLMELRLDTAADFEATSVFPAWSGRQWVRPCAGLVAAVLLACTLYAISPSVTEIRSPDGGTPLLLADVVQQAGDWPGYRGPTQQGLVPSDGPTSPPAAQGHLPVWGHHTSGVTSSPCVWGQSVFYLEQSAQSGARLVCLHRETGAMLWSSRWDDAVPSSTSRQLPTPVCDGNHVFLPVTTKGRLQLHAWTLEGQRVWTCDAGPWSNPAAKIVSPVVHGPLVILAADQARNAWSFWQAHSYVVAIHRATGEIVWRTLRPDGASSGVPIVAKVADREQLILAARGGIRSYDPATGKELWLCRWRSNRVDCGVVTDAEHVYAASGAPDGEILCLRADGTGDVTDTHVVWRDRRLVVDPVALTLADAVLIHQQGDGTLLAVDTGTGKMVWRKKLSATLAAPVLRYRSQLLCADDTGTIHLLDLQRRGETIYEARLGTGVLASPAAIDSGLMMATAQGLIRLKTAPAAVAQEPTPPQLTR